MTTRQRVYCVFEGAGARGLAHIGALKAIFENKGIDIVGYAGTSAGAIVAALAASGYEPTEIYSPETQDSILKKVDRDSSNNDVTVTKVPAITPVGLLGTAAWKKISLLRSFIHKRKFLFTCFSAVLAICMIFGIIFFQRIIIILFISIIISSILYARHLARGLVSLQHINDAVNQLLLMKLKGKRQGDPVTFRMLSEMGLPPLRIVAANVTTSELTIFSSETTPEISVAEAVCASICIPIVFKPFEISGNSYFDGGLVSNLPTWAFDEERECDRDALTAAIQIKEKTEASNGKNEMWPPFSALKAMLYGTDLLNKRAVDRLTTTTLEVDLGLLDFDLTATEADEILSQAEGYCKVDLIKRMIELPQKINSVCGEVAGECTRLVNEVHSAFGVTDFNCSIRVAVGIRSPTNKSVKIEFSSGFEQLTDERIRLPVDSSLMGEALTKNRSLYVSADDPTNWERYLARPQDRWVKKMIYPKLQWILCIPLVVGDNKTLVIAIDGESLLKLGYDDQQNLLNGLEDIILDKFDFLREVEKELPNAS